MGTVSLRRPGAAALLAALAVLLLAAPAAWSQSSPEDALDQVEAIAEGDGVVTGHELSPALAQLNEARPDMSAAERRRTNRILARPTDDDDDGPGSLGPYTVDSTSSCTEHFCVHWVESTDDAPPGADEDDATIPPYVEEVKATLENVYAVENGTLGWALPLPDADLGGDDRTDVYLQDIGSEGLFGYVSPDPQPFSRSLYSYLVLDDDYAEFGYPTHLPPLQVTAAHEYNHVLQYVYDALQDTWMFESTATWMEDKVYDSINDYLSYLDDWAELPGQPITFAGDDDDVTEPTDLKIYGSAIWNHWLDTRFGATTVRRAWAVSQANSRAGGGFAPAAYDRAIRDAGGAGFAPELADFLAATVEWDAANSGIREGATFPDEVARGAMSIGGPAVSGTIDHTALAAYGVPPTNASSLFLTGTLPPGTAGAVALVGFDSGTQTRVSASFDGDGNTTVQLPDPGRFERITAVIANTDTTENGYDGDAFDWFWARDDQPFTLSAATSAPPQPTPTPTPTATASPTASPTPVPTPVPTVEPPDPTSVRLSRATTRFRTASLRGRFEFVLNTNKTGRLTARATVDRKTAKRLKMGRKRTLGTLTATVTRTGPVKVAVKLSRKLRKVLKRQRKSLKVSVRAMFVPSDGSPAVTRTLSVRLKR